MIIETWRRHYNEVRPHSSLGYLTPWHDCQKQRPVMQRARTLRCASLRALARCMTGSARSTCMKYGTPSQANPGPKNPGRSVSSGTNSVPVDTFDRVRDPVYECP